MNYKNLQDEVLAIRFDESERSRVKTWLDLRYQWIWMQAEWTFKRVTQAPLVVTGGSATPTMPPDFAKVLRFYDDLGYPLSYIGSNDYDLMSQQPGPVSGRASFYSVTNRQIYLFPVPPGNATYKLSYKRRLSHVDPILGVIGGTMQDDGDQPFWPAEHDYTLVVDAAILGQQLNNDPYWQTLVPQRDELLDSMKRDLTSDVSEQIGQWGSDADYTTAPLWGF